MHPRTKSHLQYDGNDGARFVPKVHVVPILVPSQHECGDIWGEIDAFTPSEGKGMSTFVYAYPSQWNNPFKAHITNSGAVLPANTSVT